MLTRQEITEEYRVMTSYACLSQRLRKMDVEDWVENPIQKKKTHGVRDLLSSLWGTGVFWSVLALWGFPLIPLWKKEHEHKLSYLGFSGAWVVKTCLQNKLGSELEVKLFHMSISHGLLFYPKIVFVVQLKPLLKMKLEAVCRVNTHK